MGFLSAIPLRIWAYLAIAASLAGILAHDHYMTRRAQARAAEVRSLTATLSQERANAAQVQADLKLNQVTSHALQERLTAIERERRDAPLPRLRCTASVPNDVTEAGSASGSSRTTGGREPEAVDFDPSAQLDEFGNDCAVIAERLSTLQQWERDRSH